MMSISEDQTMYHYTNIDPVGPQSTIMTEGMYANSSYTTLGNLTPNQAATMLGIPTPTHALEFCPNPNFRSIGPVQSVPKRGFIGGAPDYTHPGRPIPSGFRRLR
jgi:hypothetical protein